MSRKHIVTKVEFPNNIINDIIYFEHPKDNKYDDININIDIIVALNRIIFNLDERQYKIIMMRYKDKMTYDQIANWLNLTEERIRQIILRSLKKMSDHNHNLEDIINNAISKYKYDDTNASLIIEKVFITDHITSSFAYHQTIFKDIGIPGNINLDIIKGIDFVISKLPEQTRRLFNMVYVLNIAPYKVALIEGINVNDVQDAIRIALEILQFPEYIGYIKYGFYEYNKQLSAKILPISKGENTPLWYSEFTMDDMNKFYYQLKYYTTTSIDLIPKSLRFSDEIIDILKDNDMITIKNIVWHLKRNTATYINLPLDGNQRLEIITKLKDISILVDNEIDTSKNLKLLNHDIDDLHLSPRCNRWLHRHYGAKVTNDSKYILTVERLIELVQSNERWSEGMSKFGIECKEEVENKLRSLRLL